MNLLGYSDSEGSDDDTPQISRPAARPAPKPSFQKVIDRSQPGKIKLNLPAPTQQKTSKDDIEADAPPAKKLRTGGALGGFNAMLPAPKKSGAVAPAASDAGEEGAVVAGKRGAGRGLASGVSLKTGAEPAFKREIRLIDDDDETGIPKSNSDFRASLNLPPPRTEPGSNTTPVVESTKEVASRVQTEAKPAKKPVKFMPLSVARGKKRKPAMAAAPVPAPGASKTASAQSTVDSTPVAKPKISLFGAAQTDQATIVSGTSSGAYEPLLYGQESDHEDSDVPEDAGGTDAYDAQYVQAPRGIPPANQNLTDIAAELNLSESERRQLLGRRGRGDNLAGANIVDFNIDREYAHNEQVRLQGETVQHNALKSISGTGKNSLRSLINVAVTQKDALEDHFAQGKKNKREAGSKYGW